MENTENESPTPETSSVSMVFQVLYAPDRRLWRITCGTMTLEYNQEEFLDQLTSYFGFVLGMEGNPGTKGDFTFESPRQGTIQLGNIELVSAENLLCYLLRCNFAFELSKRGVI